MQTTDILNTLSRAHVNKVTTCLWNVLTQSKGREILYHYEHTYRHKIRYERKMDTLDGLKNNIHYKLFDQMPWTTSPTLKVD